MAFFFNSPPNVYRWFTYLSLLRTKGICYGRFCMPITHREGYRTCAQSYKTYITLLQMNGGRVTNRGTRARPILFLIDTRVFIVYGALFLLILSNHSILLVLHACAYRCLRLSFLLDHIARDDFFQSTVLEENL